MTLAKRFLNTVEAATYTGYAPATLEKLRCLRGGPAFTHRIGGRRIVYDVQDLDSWMLACRRNSTSEQTAILKNQDRPAE